MFRQEAPFEEREREQRIQYISKRKLIKGLPNFILIYFADEENSNDWILV